MHDARGHVHMTTSHDQGSITEDYPTGSVMDCLLIDWIRCCWKMDSWHNSLTVSVEWSDLKSVLTVFSMFVKSLTVSSLTPGQLNSPTSRCNGVTVALPLALYWGMWLILSKCAEIKKWKCILVYTLLFLFVCLKKQKNNNGEFVFKVESRTFWRDWGNYLSIVVVCSLKRKRKTLVSII